MSTALNPRIKLAKQGGHYAYARNGNAHNPTFYPRWSAWVDGVQVTSGQATRREAREVAELYLETEAK